MMNDERGLTDEEVEQEIQDKGLTAPRVTPDMVEDTIVAAEYLYPTIGDGTLTICVLLLSNGFTVTGESACVDPANFDADLGRRIAREDAKNTIWALEGYLLKSKLTGGTEE